MSSDSITLGLLKNRAGDGDPTYSSIKEIPTGYDIAYSFDGGVKWNYVGGEAEKDDLPATIDISDVKTEKQHIIFNLVANENSEDDGLVVLSETVELTSEIPGKDAYVGYLTDSMGVVSCDANGEPTAGLVLATEFKVTNGTVTNVSLWDESGNALVNGNLPFTYEIDSEYPGKVTFSTFKRTLPETTRIVLKAEYTDGEGNTVLEGDALVYTIAKLKVAEASTVVDFSNDNIIIPCDENGTMLTNTVTTYVAMMHGDETLFLNLDSDLLGTDSGISLDKTEENRKNGYYPLTITIPDMGSNNIHSVIVPLVGTSVNKVEYKRTGQVILSKVKAGESGHIWDLVMSTDNPKFNNDTDKFDDDYIEGWVNI